MDSLSAMARGEASRGNRSKVFDWDRAATIIREGNHQNACAGLSQDWEWTGGDILADGEPVYDQGCYLASTWAIPELDVNMDGAVPCWRWVDTTDGWDAHTQWPASALAILSGIPEDVA